ncbi:uncharacterized protein LOC110246838 isoform X2 [Exaiptasia diaphana]|uniref:MD-2-related lipid-recognition domain-containing protein n=1 Tax=Exaiptasia diaphana TaxID=2652724 RepID=A0A913YPZ7_EXADI|nr:uncharacterized protein LOC110246838 isoform X2 [Exaiptasia diaphana]
MFAIVLPCLLLALSISLSTETYIMYPVHSPIHSKLITNQSMMYGCTKRDPTAKVTLHPKHLTCRQPMTVSIQFTPIDIPVFSCYGEMYLNGILLARMHPTDICAKKWIKCPMLKGKLQHQSISIILPCWSFKGHYLFKGYCTNFDGSMLGCGQYSLTFHGFGL